MAGSSRPHPDHPCRQPGPAAQARRVPQADRGRPALRQGGLRGLPEESRSRRSCASRSRPASTSSATASSARAATGRSTSTTGSAASSTRPATPEEMKDPMSSAGGGQDREAFPEFYAEYDRRLGLGARLGKRFVVNGPLTYNDADGEARHRHAEGGRRQGQRQRRVPAGGGAGERAARRQERALCRREGAAVRARRLPAPGIPGDRRCRALRADRRRLPALHAREDGAADDARRSTAPGRSFASTRSTTRCAASRRSARAITSAGAAGTARTPSTCR